MDVGPARRDDVADLARLLWLHAAPHEQANQDVEAFAVDLAAWVADHEDSHVPFVARREHVGVVGMAWLALVARVPRPGSTRRYSADVQSVYVVPEHRGEGIGSALVRAAAEHAFVGGAERVTVSSGRRAVAMYERLGFSSSPRLLQRHRESSGPA